MTKSEIALRAHNYTQRLEALDLAIENIKALPYLEKDIQMTLEIMRAEYSDKLDNLSIDKEYMITFEGGGWNTTHATNDEDALKFAKAEFDGKHTKVKSVYLSTSSARNAAIRMNQY